MTEEKTLTLYLTPEQTKKFVKIVERQKKMTESGNIDLNELQAMNEKMLGPMMEAFQWAAKNGFQTLIYIANEKTD